MLPPALWACSRRGATASALPAFLVPGAGVRVAAVASASLAFACGSGGINPSAGGRHSPTPPSGGQRRYSDISSEVSLSPRSAPEVGISEILVPDEWVEGSQPAFAAMLSLARVDSVTYSREDPKAVANFSLGLTIKRYNLVSQHTFTDPYAYCLDFVDTIAREASTSPLSALMRQATTGQEKVVVDLPGFGTGGPVAGLVPDVEPTGETATDGGPRSPSRSLGVVMLDRWSDWASSTAGCEYVEVFADGAAVHLMHNFWANVHDDELHEALFEAPAGEWHEAHANIGSPMMASIRFQ